ncbi:MAG: hypothetical protein JWN88_2144 [Frankiales bacterium]|nr:hypothetical protein [Frankiales bacterium]
MLDDGDKLGCAAPCEVEAEVLTLPLRRGDSTQVVHRPNDLSEPIRALVSAVETVARQRPVDLPADQALAEAGVLLAQLEVLHAVVLERVADVDTRKLHVLAGAPSTGTWVARQQTSLDRGEVALARRLDGLPGVAAALGAGTVSVECGRRVAAALTRLRRHLDRPDGLIDGQPGQQTVAAVVVDGVLTCICEALGGLSEDDPRVLTLQAQLSEIAARRVSELSRLEAAFLVLARQVEPALLPSALTRLVDALLPNDLEARSDAAHDERGFGLRRKADGSGWTITDGELDLECGELLQTVLTAELAVDEDNPADTAAYALARADGWQPGGPLPACAGPRSLRRRRHDALKNGLRRYLDAGIAGQRDRQAPHLAVTVSAEALSGAPGSLGPVTGSGTLLPRSLVRRWSCDSAVTRFVLSLGRKVIEASHTERTLKPHERRAKRIETGGHCQGAGCTRGPGSRLVPHHADPWARSRTTSLSGTVLLCEQTHHDLHSGGHFIRLKDGRLLGPDGWACSDEIS